jgi:hypothetical protein
MTRITVTLYKDKYFLMNYRRIVLGIKNVSEKAVEKFKTQI